MIVKLLTEHHLEFQSLKGGCRGLSEPTPLKMPHCWKSHATAHFIFKRFGCPYQPSSSSLLFAREQRRPRRPLCAYAQNSPSRFLADPISTVYRNLVYLRNTFDVWNVHGIMNTSTLLQSKRKARIMNTLALLQSKGFTLTFQESTWLSCKVSEIRRASR